MSDLRDKTVQYISERFAKEDEVLKTVLKKQEAGGGPMMNVGPDQGKFLYLLTKMLKAKNILELGSYYGYSTVWFARAVKELEGSHIHCVEVSSEYCDIIAEHLKLDGTEAYAEIHQGSGLDMMNKFIKEGKKFDLIFVDADKGNYSNYLDLAYELLPKGGTLLVDNCIWYGKVLEKAEDKNTAAIQAFNDKLAADTRFESSIATIQDGMAIAIKL